MAGAGRKEGMKEGRWEGGKREDGERRGVRKLKKN
jgi:hypothetical protein